MRFPVPRRAKLALIAAVIPIACGSPTPMLAHKNQPQPTQQHCIDTTQAANFQNKDVCVSAHVYDVVELKDGTRFMDVCPLSMPDAECRFLILSLYQDHGEVGELRRYQNQNVLIRGVIRPMHGRMGIMVSNARQFTGGPEKFRPNPLLLRGFFGQSDMMPVLDPNLTAHGRQRSFMNRYLTEQVPAKSSK